MIKMNSDHALDDEAVVVFGWNNVAHRIVLIKDTDEKLTHFDIHDL